MLKPLLHRTTLVKPQSNAVAAPDRVSHIANVISGSAAPLQDAGASTVCLSNQ